MWIIVEFYAVRPLVQVGTHLDNHHIKQVLPHHVAREVAVEGVLHQPLCILQITVCDHHQLNAGIVLIEKGSGSVWVQLNELRWVLRGYSDQGRVKSRCGR